MQINFNNGNSKSSEKNEHKLEEGDYTSMVKLRKKKLPEIEESIQDILKNYDGQSIVILVQHEDENGLPDNTQLLMAGVSRMECQLSVSRALNKASKEALKVLLQSAGSDTNALMTIALAVTKLAEEEEKK